ncbi:hypothetical protein D3C78_1459860 [compost metagenome]
MGAHDDQAGIAGLGFHLDALGDFLAGAFLADAVEGRLHAVSGNLFPGLGQGVVGGFQGRFAKGFGVVVDGIVGQVAKRAVDDGDDAQFAAAQFRELDRFCQGAVGNRTAVHRYQNAFVHDVFPRYVIGVGKL